MALFLRDALRSLGPLLQGGLMSNMIAICDGAWIENIAGALECDGTLMQVEDSYFKWLPSLTYEDANELLVAIGALYATVFIYLLVARFINDQKPD